MKLIIFITSLFFSGIIFPQCRVIEIWNGNVPGSISNKDFTESSVIVNGRERVSHVVNPTLTIYSPPDSINSGAAIIIFPGGGYSHLAFQHEGYEIAKWLNKSGITGVVVKYRLPNDTIMIKKSIGPLQDAQESVRIIRRMASELKIDYNKIGVMGFSAGGHLASTLSTHFIDKFYESDTVSCRPDFSALIYPVISMGDLNTHTGSRKNLLSKNASKEDIIYFSNELHVTKDTPPAFLVHSGDDKSVPVQNTIDYYSSLSKNGISAEMHIFPSGGHGYGLTYSKQGNESQWGNLLISWLKQMTFHFPAGSHGGKVR